MDRSIRVLFGIEDDGKRLYRITEGEVDVDEFNCCKVMEQVLFGDKGLIDTLGPTWNLVHDPRFVKIENCFLRQRKAMFGGNANVGQQYISGGGAFTSTEIDLQEYSEILGEGRHFLKYLNSAGIDPKTFYQADDEVVWNVIRKECPNYFFRPAKGMVYGEPNYMAKTLYNLFRCDLVGIIHDYAQEALVQEWISIETGQLAEPDEMLNPEIHKVYMEVDNLEQALTLRASLRVTAAKVVKQLGVLPLIERVGRLTDLEIDELLRIVYASNWPDDKPMLLVNISNYLRKVASVPFEERQELQLKLAVENSKAVIKGLQSGEIKPINRTTDPALDKSEDSEGRVLNDIMENPLKMHFFLQYTQAEKQNHTAAVGILKPVFDDPDYEINEENFDRLTKQLIEVGFYQKDLTNVEENFDGKSL